MIMNGERVPLSHARPGRRCQRTWICKCVWTARLVATAATWKARKITEKNYMGNGFIAGCVNAAAVTAVAACYCCCHGPPCRCLPSRSPSADSGILPEVVSRSLQAIATAAVPFCGKESVAHSTHENRKRWRGPDSLRILGTASPPSRWAAAEAKGRVYPAPQS